MKHVEWKPQTAAPSHFVASVPTNGPGDRTGEYRIHLNRRPAYCDRGDWLILVDYHGDALATSYDGADGFPRYFFGDAAQAKAQMEEWVRRRKECQ